MASATLQRHMGRVFKGYEWEFIITYVDDTIVYSDDEAQHKAHLKKTMQRLHAAGHSLKAAKCHLFCEEVEFLTYRV